MPFNLAQIVRRTRNPKRRIIAIRAIRPTGVQAQGLYSGAYVPIVEFWSAQIPKLIAEYERSLSALTTDSAADIGRILSDADNAATRLFILIRPALNRWAILTELWHRRTWRGAVLSATGVDLDTLIGPEGARETLAAAIERNVALVRSVSDQARTRMADSVFRGLTQRTPAREVAAELREAVDMSRRRSISIASDQQSKIAAALDQERRREAGINEWKWRSSHKLHYRPEHQARDGNIYSDANPPPTYPAQEPNCGCSSEAILRFD